jgi:hypothetical protein
MPQRAASAATSLARGPLRADEHQGSALRDELADEFGGLLVQRHRLLEIDDVDLIALAEDELGHLRIPESGFGGRNAHPLPASGASKRR